jgi:cysteine desulfurase
MLEESRERCAAVLGVKSEYIFFTSGGTESNAVVLRSLQPRSGGAALLCGAGEHPSVRENADMFARQGGKTVVTALEPYGAPSARTVLDALEKAESPRMLGVMGVNNETGAVTDIASIVNVLHSRKGAPLHLHCDLIQQTGKVPPGIPLSEIDSAAVSAHKIGGPRGIGILYTRKKLEPFFSGGGQERGLRPGTENVAGAFALAECLEKRAAPEILRAEYAAAERRMAVFVSEMKKNARFKTVPADRAVADGRFSPWILQCALAGIPGGALVRALDEAGFAVSTGSACSARKKDRPVLAAMGIDRDTAFEGIRISQGWSTTDADLAALAGALGGITRKY